MEHRRRGALLSLRAHGGRQPQGSPDRAVGVVPLTARERILVLSDVARGLADLHSQVVIIHRYVKSANVLLDRGCVGRIGDFGIAKSVKKDRGLTETQKTDRCYSLYFRP